MPLQPSRRNSQAALVILVVAALLTAYASLLSASGSDRYGKVALAAFASWVACAVLGIPVLRAAMKERQASSRQGPGTP